MDPVTPRRFAAAVLTQAAKEEDDLGARITTGLHGLSSSVDGQLRRERKKRESSLQTSMAFVLASQAKATAPSGTPATLPVLTVDAKGDMDRASKNTCTSHCAPHLTLFLQGSPASSEGGDLTTASDMVGFCVHGLLIKDSALMMRQLTVGSEEGDLTAASDMASLFICFLGEAA